MQVSIAIAIGGGVGSLLRYWISQFMQVQSGFPYSTLFVNILGCLLLGVLTVWLPEGTPENQAVRLGLTTGLMGGFTTYSTFGVETVTLIERGSTGTALAYIGLSIVLGIFAAYIGILLGKMAL